MRLRCNLNVMRHIRLRRNKRVRNSLLPVLSPSRDSSLLPVLNPSKGSSPLLVLNLPRALSRLQGRNLLSVLHLQHARSLKLVLHLLLVRLRLHGLLRRLMRLRQGVRRSIARVGFWLILGCFARSGGRSAMCKSRCSDVQITVIYGGLFTVDQAVAS